MPICRLYSKDRAFGDGLQLDQTYMFNFPVWFLPMIILAIILCVPFSPPKSSMDFVTLL